MRNLFFLILFLSHTGFAQESIVRLWQKGNQAAKVSGEQALLLYQRAYEQAKKENNILWQANICVDLSGSLYEQGNFQKAADRCTEGLKLIKDNKFVSDSTEFKLHSALAACFKSLNNLQSAFQHYELANQIFHKHPELENQILLYVTFHYSNQGGIWYSLGDMNRALIYYEKGLLLAEKLTNKSDYALILDNISSIYLYKQDFSKAIQLFEKAINSYETQNKSIFNIPLSEMYLSLANCYFKVGEYPKTLQLTRISRKIAEINLPAEEAIRLISSTIILEANVYIKDGHIEKAKKIFTQIIEKENNYSSYLYNKHFEAYLGLSEIEILNGNYPLVLTHTQKALSEISGVKSIREFENPEGNHSIYVYIGISRVLNMKIEALHKLYEEKKHLKFLYAAFETQKLSVEIAKKIRQSHETMESKALFSHLFYNKYEKLIELSFLLYEKTQSEKYLKYSFNIVEESKSIILADNLALQNSYRNSGSDSLINKLKANQAYLAYLKSSSEKKIDAIKTYEQKVNQILEKLNIVNKSFSESFKSDNPINLKAFQKNLDPKSVYLNYILIKNQIYVTLVSNNKIFVKRISIISNELVHHKNLLKTALTTNPGPYSGFKARKSAAYFYNILIKPFEADLKGIDNLIINPDNEMIELSFDILVPHEKSDDYLIKKYNISYLNSALNYNDKIKNKFSRADQNWLSFAPFGSKTKNSNDINIQNLTILPSTIKEINGIKGQSIINEKSTKQTFVKTISDLKDRVILIATHASENNGEPYLNFFPANNNYKLYANEIQYLDFKTPLVILGACESNAGKKMKGSGVLSIAKAFSIGGCPSVVGSLWEVHDESMAVLVSLFYKHLMRGERKDVALRLAKLEYLETETGLRNDPPYYWAHLQIIGDVSPLIIWPVILRYVMYGLMVVILSGSIVYGIRSRKRFFN